MDKRPLRTLVLLNKWDKVFNSGLSKSCGRQPLKIFKGYGLSTANVFLGISWSF